MQHNLYSWMCDAPPRVTWQGIAIGVAIAYGWLAVAIGVGKALKRRFGDDP